MTQIRFGNGTVIDFNGTPTQEDIEEVARNLNISTPQVRKKAGTKLGTATKIVNKVFPGGKVGEAIGTLGASLVRRAQGRKEEAEIIERSAPSVKSVVGDVALGGLSIAGFKGAGETGSFLARVLKLSGLGAGIGASQAVSEDKGLKDVVKSAAISGAIGGTLPVVGAGIRAVGRQIKNLPARFVNSALGRGKAEILKDIAKDKTDDFANYVIAKKPVGTAQTLLADSIDGVKKTNGNVRKLLDSAVRKSGSKVTIGIDNVLDNVVKSPQASGALMNRPAVTEVIERLAPQTKRFLRKKSLTLPEANSLRQMLDETLGDRAFLGAQLSSDKAILKNFADALRGTVKSKGPIGTKELFSELANEIRFRDALLERIAQRSGNNVLTFGDLVGGGIGMVGGPVGAVTGVALRRAVESTPFKFGAAKVIQAVSKVAPTIEAMTPSQQTAILILISELLSPDEK